MISSARKACGTAKFARRCGNCPPAGMAEGWRLCVVARSRPQCRAGVHARREVCGGPEGYWQGRVPPPSVCAFRRSHLPLQGRLSTSIDCGITASLPASLFRPAGAGRSPIGRPGELLRSEKRRTTRHKPYGAANAAILGRPHLAPGDSQGDRSPLEPCPPPRN